MINRYNKRNFNGAHFNGQTALGSNQQSSDNNTAKQPSEKSSKIGPVQLFKQQHQQQQQPFQNFYPSKRNSILSETSFASSSLDSTNKVAAVDNHKKIAEQHVFNKNEESLFFDKAITFIIKENINVDTIKVDFGSLLNDSFEAQGPFQGPFQGPVQGHLQQNHQNHPCVIDLNGFEISVHTIRVHSPCIIKNGTVRANHVHVEIPEELYGSFTSNAHADSHKRSAALFNNNNSNNNNHQDQSLQASLMFDDIGKDHSQFLFSCQNVEFLTFFGSSSSSRISSPNSENKHSKIGQEAALIDCVNTSFIKIKQCVFGKCLQAEDLADPDFFLARQASAISLRDCENVSIKQCVFALCVDDPFENAATTTETTETTPRMILKSETRDDQEDDDKRTSHYFLRPSRGSAIRMEKSENVFVSDCESMCINTEHVGKEKKEQKEEKEEKKEKKEKEALGTNISMVLIENCMGVRLEKLISHDISSPFGNACVVHARESENVFIKQLFGGCVTAGSELHGYSRVPPQACLVCIEECKKIIMEDLTKEKISSIAPPMLVYLKNDSIFYLKV